LILRSSDSSPAAAPTPNKISAMAIPIPLVDEMPSCETLGPEGLVATRRFRVMMRPEEFTRDRVLEVVAERRGVRQGDKHPYWSAAKAIAPRSVTAEQLGHNLIYAYAVFQYRLPSREDVRDDIRRRWAAYPTVRRRRTA
jgi:hypothetical protein